MNLIKYILGFLLEGTFIKGIIKAPQHIANLKYLKKIDLSNIEKYFIKNKRQGISERNILIEVFFEHPPMNINNFIIHLLLGHRYATSTIALIYNYWFFECKYLSKKCNIKDVAYIYNWAFLFYKIKAVLAFIKNIKHLTYTEDFGWHIFADGIDIGDLVYDGFLRYTNLPTYRKMDTRFALYIINYLFYFYRYKAIIKKNKITDIILSDLVYDYGILVRAASTFDRKIFIYASYGHKPIDISVNIASKNIIPKQRTFDPCLLEKLIELYGKDSLLKEYDIYFNKRINADDSNQLDLQYVYKNTEINSIADFNKYYQRHTKGKNIFIFSHAFVDAVKYCDLFFSDYYTWLYETCRRLTKKSNIHNIYVKPHPSEILYKCVVTVKDVIKEINNKYDGEIVFLDKKVNNKIIFNIADIIVTGAGTIAVEAAPQGIPVLVAARTYYEKVNMVIQPQTKDEYFKYLDNIEKVSSPSKDIVERAKLYFMLFSKYFFVSASFLSRFSIEDMSKDMTAQLKEKYYHLYNALFQSEIPLAEEPLFQMFEFMIDNGFHDTIDLTHTVS
jgi:hypothetical protein